MTAMVPNDQPTEASPLLADATHSPDTTVRPSDYAPRDISWRKSWLKWYPFVAAALLVLMADVPAYMAEVAKLRVFEDAVCRRYYQDADPDLGGDIGSIPEHLCKLPEIQSRLAQMKGLLSFVDGAPGLLLAIPFGILADRLGHRPIIGLAVIGCTLHDLWLLVVFWFHNVFPINAIYAAPGFFLVGGGSVVLSSISLSMIAAAVPQALRTRAFFWVQVILLVAEMVAPPLGALVMDTIGPHAAFLITTCTACTCLIVLPFTPDPLPTEDKSEGGSGDEQEALVPGDGASDREEPAAPSDDGPLDRLLKALRPDGVVRTAGSGLIVGLLVLVFGKMWRPLLEVILQYMSVRFKWPLGKTAILLSIQAAVQVPLFAIILPQIDKWLLKRNPSVSAANLATVRGSLVFLVAGCCAMALSTTAPLFIVSLIVFTMGAGFASALRSFLSSLVPRNHLSMLFTAIAVFDGIAFLGSGPLLQLCLSTGIKLGGVAVGLPFFVAATLYTVALGMVQLERVGR